MTDSEKLNLIFLNMQSIQSDMQDMKTDMQNMKSDMRNMKSDMQDMKSDMQELKRRTTNIELHLENSTDRNILLLADNIIELADKLNQAISASVKNLAYEIKINYLAEDIKNLKQDLAIIKDKTV